MEPQTLGLLLTTLLTMWQEFRWQKEKRKAKKAEKVTDILPGKRGKK